ncbi:MAG: M1 family aminopeptidase [Rhodothermales bacterium]
MSVRAVCKSFPLLLLCLFCLLGTAGPVFAQDVTSTAGLTTGVSGQASNAQPGNAAALLSNGTRPTEEDSIEVPTHSLFTGPIHEPQPLTFDQEHIRLALRFEPDAGQIFGVAKLRIRPTSDTLNTLRFAAKDLSIYSVQVGVLDSLKVESPYSDTSSGYLDIALDSLQVRGVPFEVQITYRASPKAGMYFRDVNKSDTTHQVHIWTDGSKMGNIHWIPLLDNPSDRLTSEIIATIPPALDVLSNGRLTQQMTTEDGMSLFHYVQDQSHKPGDIGMFIGRFKKSEQTIRLNNGFSIAIQQWMSDKSAEHIERSMAEIPGIMSFMSEKLDFTYPWPVYSQLIFEDQYLPDMSFTGFTAFNDRILLDERAIVDQPNTLRLATSIARQWYGHMLSVDHWSDIWLTESIATFLGLMYIKSAHGDAPYYAHLNQLSKDYFEEADQYQRPLVWNQWHAPEQLLDQHARSKGVWFLHALMSNLGEEAFWEFLQTYTRQQAFQTTNTDQLLSALATETNTGIEGQFDSFFDDWVYSAGHPEIKLDYQYDLVSESLYVSIEQLQEGYLVPPVFHLDLPIESYSLTGPLRTNLKVTERDQLVSIPTSIQPRFVILDPEHALLSKITVEQSANAWVSQLRYASHPLSQLDAIEELHAYADDPALFIGLQSALKSRSIPEVRAGIIALISKLPQSDATKRILLETYESDDSPLVKRAVLKGLEQFDDHADLTILAMDAAQSAQSYLLQAQAVASLVKIGAPNADDLLQSALITPAYKDVIRQTAIRSIVHTSMSTKERVKVAADFSRPRHSIEVRLAAMEMLAGLAALQNKKSLSTLTDLLEDEDIIVRQSAAAYIGELGSDDQLDDLRKQLKGEHNPRAIYAFEDAIRTIEARQ